MMHITFDTLFIHHYFYGPWSYSQTSALHKLPVAWFPDSPVSCHGHWETQGKKPSFVGTSFTLSQALSRGKNTSCAQEH